MACADVVAEEPNLSVRSMVTPVTVVATTGVLCDVGCSGEGQRCWKVTYLIICVRVVGVVTLNWRPVQLFKSGIIWRTMGRWGPPSSKGGVCRVTNRTLGGKGFVYFVLTT